MRMLVFSPHPDDSEYSVSGTILKYTTNCSIFCFGSGTKGDDSLTRIQEIKDFWKDISEVSLKFGHGIQELDERKWINLLENIYDIDDYDHILIPPFDDTHFEHRLVHNIGNAIARASNISVLEYRTPSTKDCWIPNLFVDITDYYAFKMQRLKTIKTQHKHTYFNQRFMDGFHFNSNAAKCGHMLVEQFRVTRWLS